MQEQISEQTLLGVSSACAPWTVFDGVNGFWSLSGFLAIVVVMRVVSGVGIRCDGMQMGTLA